MAEAEVETLGVRVRALARQLSREAVLALEAQLLALHDPYRGFEVRMPAVVHQSSSARRAATIAAKLPSATTAVTIWAARPPYVSSICWNAGSSLAAKQSS